MLHETVIILISFAYLGLLFAIAYYADERADAGRSVIASPYIYSLSLAVYATAWTFYGSVGRAASDGVGFLPIYIGPTLMIALWWVVLRKILRISKQNRITSLADFIASRYGKSALLGGLVTVIAVDRHPSLHLAAAEGGVEQLHDPRASTRRSSCRRKVARGVDPPGHGAVGGADPRRLHHRLRHAPSRRGRAPPGHGRRDRLRVAGEAARVPRRRACSSPSACTTASATCSRARRREPKLRAMLTPLEGVAGGYANWVWLTILSMMAIMFLPRQFQVAVIENVDEKHLNKAIWLFPLYMLAINVFVLPIAFGGLLRFPGRQRRRGHVRAHAADGGEAASCSRCSCSSADCRPPPAW